MDIDMEDLAEQTNRPSLAVCVVLCVFLAIDFSFWKIQRSIWIGWHNAMRIAASTPTNKISYNNRNSNSNIITSAPSALQSIRVILAGSTLSASTPLRPTALPGSTP